MGTANTPRLVFVGLILALAIAGGAQPNAQERKANRPVEREMLRSARDAYESNLALWQRGPYGDPEVVYRWSRRIMEVEREIASTEAERTAAVRAHAERMQSSRKTIEDLVNEGRIPGFAGAAADFYYFEAQALLSE